MHRKVERIFGNVQVRKYSDVWVQGDGTSLKRGESGIGEDGSFGL